MEQLKKEIKIRKKLAPSVYQPMYILQIIVSYNDVQQMNRKTFLFSFLFHGKTSLFSFWKGMKIYFFFGSYVSILDERVSLSY